jgi:hypothetical protein
MQYRDNGEIFALSDTTNIVTVNVHTPATKRLKANFNTINMYSFGGTSTARHSVSGSFDVTY